MIITSTGKLLKRTQYSFNPKDQTVRILITILRRHYFKKAPAESFQLYPDERLTVATAAPKPSPTLAEERVRKSSVSEKRNEEMSPIGHCVGIFMTLEVMSIFFHDGGGGHDSTQISCIV